MSEPIFLSNNEVHELTGREYPAAQRRSLDAMGITYKTNAIGKVIVLRDHVMTILNGQKQRTADKGVRFDLVR